MISPAGAVITAEDLLCRRINHFETNIIIMKDNRECVWYIHTSEVGNKAFSSDKHEGLATILSES